MPNIQARAVIRNHITDTINPHEDMEPKQFHAHRLNHLKIVQFYNVCHVELNIRLG